MSTLHFALLALGLFALAFIGISWGNKGFPVMAMKAEPLKPDVRIPTFEENVKKGFSLDELRPYARTPIAAMTKGTRVSAKPCAS